MGMFFLCWGIFLIGFVFGLIWAGRPVAEDDVSVSGCLDKAGVSKVVGGRFYFQ